jgi:hypothetical protein
MLLKRGHILRLELDVVVFAGVEEKANPAFDQGVVVAFHLEAVAQGDALCGPRRRGKRRRDCHRDEKIPAHRL